MSPPKITSENWKEFQESAKDKLAVIFFDAEFTEQKDIVEAGIKALVKKGSDEFILATCDAEEHHQVASELEVVSLPCVVFLKGGKDAKKWTNLEPANLGKILDLELTVQKQTKPEITDPKEKKRLYFQTLTNSAPIMVFMKGDPQQPRCGFSKQLVGLLSRNNVKYESFNILEDEEVRQGLKEYSDWPTYPQIYAKGTFVGGLDILKQLEESGELSQALHKD